MGLDLMDLFYPKNCFVCAKSGSYLCKKCLKKYLKINLVQKCHVCSRVVRYGFVHSDCREKSFLDGLIYVCNYNHLVKDLVSEGKYQGIFSIFDDIGTIIGEYLNFSYNLSSFTLVPIPLFKSKLRSRGFNQAEIIAQKVSSVTSLPIAKALVRIKNTHTQVGMTKDQRESNLKNAFEPSMKLISKNVLLVDDIYTTGTTMNECAKILKSDGAEQVMGVTFAKSRE